MGEGRLEERNSINDSESDLNAKLKTNKNTPNNLTDNPNLGVSANIQSTGDKHKESTGSGIPLSSIRAKWKSIINNIKENQIGLGNCIEVCEPVEIEGNVLYIAFDPKNEFQYKRVNGNYKNIKVLQDSIHKFLQVSLSVKCRIEKLETKVDKQVEDEPKHEPIVEKILSKFDGEII